MVHELKQFTGEEIKRSQIALGMVGIQANLKGVELILHGLEAYKEMAGDMDLETASKIIAHVNKKYDKPDETEKHP